MFESNVTRMILLLLSAMTIGLFLVIVIRPDVITAIYNNIFSQQIDAQKSAETILAVIKC